jgi:hypothetical protein
MRRLMLTLAGASLALALPALAQTPPTSDNLRGTVKSLSGTTLVVAPKHGPKVTVTLSAGWNLAVVKPVEVSTIQPGSFIGTTEVDRPDGTGRSLEVHVFPPGVKMGEGHYPWDLKPHSNMTNGTVGKVVAGRKGQELDISYSTGTRHVVVPKNVPVVQITGADRGLLKPGDKVYLRTAALPGGGLGASSVVTGVGGAAPPM